MAEAVRIVGCEYKIAELERNVGQLVMEGRGDWDARGTTRTTRSRAARSPLHHARIPTHEAGSLNLLLPPAPLGR
jgi:hypothetical protein